MNKPGQSQFEASINANDIDFSQNPDGSERVTLIRVDGTREDITDVYQAREAGFVEESIEM